MLPIIRLILMLMFQCSRFPELLLKIAGEWVIQATYDTVKWGVLLALGIALKKLRPILNDFLRRSKARFSTWLRKLRRGKSPPNLIINLIIIIADKRKAATEHEHGSFICILLPPGYRQSDLRHRVKYQLIVVLIV